MSTIIVYYSLTGNVEWAVKRVAENLGADLLRLEPAKAYPDKGFKKFFWGGKSAVMAEKPTLIPYSFDAGRYDRVIFATPVWASTFTPPLRSFIRQNRDVLAGKSFAALLCFSGGGADKALEKLRAELGISEWIATLVLTDPKDRPKAGDEAQILEFCKKVS